MAKPELGNKRICASCGTKFYDLNKSPIVCPRCETVFVEEVKPAKAASVAAPVEEKEAAGDTELVSLEDAEKEQTKAKAGKPAGDDDDFDSDDETLDDDEDDPFLDDDEEEDSDDVSGLIGGGIESDDEDS